MGLRIARRLFAPLLRFLNAGSPPPPPPSPPQGAPPATVPGVGVGSVGVPWVIVRASR